MLWAKSKKSPGDVMLALVYIATVTQESFESQYYVTRALLGARSLFAMTAPRHNPLLSFLHSSFLSSFLLPLSFPSLTLLYFHCSLLPSLTFAFHALVFPSGNAFSSFYFL